MRIVGIACIAFVTTEAAKCSEAVAPYGYYVKGKEPEWVKATCSSKYKALESLAVLPADQDDYKSDCCKEPPKCSTTYQKSGGSSDTKTECPEETIVPTDLFCWTSTEDGKNCATQPESITADQAQCCRMTCKNTKGGFANWKKEQKEGLQSCPEKGGPYQLSDKYCKGSECDESKDQGTCCQKKCSVGVVLFADKKKVDDDEKVDINCGEDGDYQVSTTAHCEGPTCGADDLATCCQQKCSGTKEGKGFKTKADEAKVAEATCDLEQTVHETAFCTGSACGSDDKAQCCQTSCNTGFRLKKADKKEGSTAFCKDTDASVSESGKCKGNSCKDSDVDTCCNQKCGSAKDENEKNGFILSTDTKKHSQKQCPAGEKLAKDAVCEGDCSNDDESTCCEAAANNSTGSTNDANGVGLVASVPMLMILSASF